MRNLPWLVFGLLLIVFPCRADSPSKPDSKEKCPVCGMFVYKYPEWLAQIRLKDSRSFFF